MNTATLGMSDQIGQITAAVIAAMEITSGIEKNSNVGSGNYGYKGVQDKDVKIHVRKAMMQNGLAIFPIASNAKSRMDRWEENGKQKMSVFVEASPVFRLTHTSGEWMDLMGYGHGQDNMDKAAGKATTYALKYLLLYLFMIPTGHIDDTDEQHSNENRDMPKENPYQKAYKTSSEVKEWLTKVYDLEAIAWLYRANKEIVDADSELLSEFGKKKAHIEFESK